MDPNIRLPRELHEKLRAQAFAERRAITQTVRAAITDYLTAHTGWQAVLAASPTPEPTGKGE